MEKRDSLWEHIAGALHGELSAEEMPEFKQMMSDEGNRQQYEKARKIREALPHLSGITAESKTRSWQKVESRIRRRKVLQMTSFLKYAALVLLAFFAGNLLKPLLVADREIRYSEISVPFGQMSQLTLSDGTRVWLNSGTTLRYPERFAETRRTVSVEGEAFFEVARMPDKPFFIQTDDLQVEVLGTSFNLSAYPADASTSVTLVEGSVSVNDVAGKSIARLKPGQTATMGKNGSVLHISNVKTGFYAAWKEGKIYFEDEPLDEIARKLERWFNVEITFSEEALKSLRFSGTILKNKPIDQIMQALQILAPIRFTHEVKVNGKDMIVIYQRT